MPVNRGEPYKIVCPVCGGVGKLFRQRNLHFPTELYEVICHRCNGNKWIEQTSISYTLTQDDLDKQYQYDMERIRKDKPNE